MTCVKYCTTTALRSSCAVCELQNSNAVVNRRSQWTLGMVAIISIGLQTQSRKAPRRSFITSQRHRAVRADTPLLIDE